MILKNKLGIDYKELAMQEEKISKNKSIQLFDNSII